MGHAKRIAAVTLFVLLGATSLLVHAKGKDRVISISHDCRVDADTMIVYQHNLHDVHWEPDDDATNDSFTVVFKRDSGTPHTPCRSADGKDPVGSFMVPKGGKSGTCKITTNGGDLDSYPYCIYDAKGNLCNDPTVVVQDGKKNDYKKSLKAKSEDDCPLPKKKP
jgi:hypothetical protein